MTATLEHASRIGLDFRTPKNKEDRFQELNSIAGFLTRNEALALYTLAKDGPGEGAVVEVGSYAGRSSAYIAEGLKDGHRDQSATCIDLFNNPLNQDLLNYFRKDHILINESLFNTPGNTILEFFQSNLNRAGLTEYVDPIRGDSVSLSKSWDTPIRLLFIDANHIYMHVNADVDAWLPHLQDKGIICLHDMTCWAANVQDKSMMHYDGVTRYVETQLLHHPNLVFVHKADSLIVFQYQKNPPAHLQNYKRLCDPITFSIPFFPPVYWRYESGPPSAMENIREVNGWYADEETQIHIEDDGIRLEKYATSDTDLASFYRPVDTIIGEIYEITLYAQTEFEDHFTVVDVFGIQNWGFDLVESPHIGMRADRHINRGIHKGTGALRLQFKAYCCRSWIKISSGGTFPDSISTLSDFHFTKVS